MVNPVSLTEATAAGVGAALATGESLRRYFYRRELRQQAEFRSAVQHIVDEALAPVIARQVGQGAHLDRQDAAIAALRRAVDRKR